MRGVGAMLTSADRFVSQWSPKIGRQAANIRWRASVLLIGAYALNFVWIPCVIIGAKSGTPLLLGAGAAVAAVAGALIVAGGFKMRTSTRLASSELGVRLGVGRIAAPPRKAAHYEDWCRQHGVTPYGAEHETAKVRDDHTSRLAGD